MHPVRQQEQAAGATPKQIEASKICLLKQQLEVRLSLSGKRLTLSHKGRKKTSPQGINCIDWIEEEKKKKEREFPECLNGRKIKHKLKDDATDIAEWYDGEIVGIVTIEYVGYTDTFEWDKADIAEDIFNSDLIFL